MSIDVLMSMAVAHPELKGSLQVQFRQCIFHRVFAVWKCTRLHDKLTDYKNARWNTHSKSGA